MVDWSEGVDDKSRMTLLHGAYVPASFSLCYLDSLQYGVYRQVVLARYLTTISEINLGRVHTRIIHIRSRFWTFSDALLISEILVGDALPSP